MEDAHVLNVNFAGKGWLFGGIFDGHNGALAAQYASLTIDTKFLNYLLSGLSPDKAFDEAYRSISERLKHQESGTTAVTFLIKDKTIYTANVGDSRAIIIGAATIHQLTVDHRVNNREEETRILTMGGRIRGSYVMRGNQGLMPTRTIGDEYFKPVGIIADPSVGTYSITDDDLFLIAACDGLFDFMTNDDVAECCREYTAPESLVERLRTEVLINRHGMDNLTIIAVYLKD